ncbi:MAG TPA: hypothetical protein VK753_10715 [Xanthomonadaceae bacterium]|jgi:hypothetical protein|nr:hypothetical protein [Xanthomonadaceae bacterium]
MDAHLMLLVQSAASLFAGIIMIAGLFVLWSKTPSGWLLLALAAEGISMVFRLAYAVVPSMLVGIPAFTMVWSATGLMVAAGVMGYALEQPGRRTGG